MDFASIFVAVSVYGTAPRRPPHLELHPAVLMPVLVPIHLVGDPLASPPPPAFLPVARDAVAEPHSDARIPTDTIKRSVESPILRGLEDELLEDGVACHGGHPQASNDGQGVRGPLGSPHGALLLEVRGERLLLRPTLHLRQRRLAPATPRPSARAAPGGQPPPEAPAPPFKPP